MKLPPSMRLSPHPARATSSRGGDVPLPEVLIALTAAGAGVVGASVVTSRRPRLRR